MNVFTTFAFDLFNKLQIANATTTTTTTTNTKCLYSVETVQLFERRGGEELSTV